ncbi:hypothetical protein [Sporosarcina sp. NPDC096371]|uniref:hypothetical protein n=1 Tax=Sporosarcina sp. NPDC096371 TaxID=3364530 RepID=UPI00381F21F5
MINFIDKHYEKITWFILLLGFILLFVANEYLSIALFSYLIIKSIKFRKSIRTTLQKTPRSTIIIYALGMITLIVTMTVIMLYSSRFIQKYSISIPFQYIYIVIILFSSLIFYIWFMDFLVKLWGKKQASN